ncbi:MAG: glycosyltransferase family 10 [Pirellulaceae bacterium]|nr:glycosyltransferase family 10 [Pirellulaceae bacterium]
MKPKLRIAMTDMWRRDFDPRRNFIWRYLGEMYDLELASGPADKPHVLFFSCFGKQHRTYRCRRIYYTGENVPPDWRHCDYALSFEHTDHPDHHRLPNYAHSGYGDLAKLVKGGEIDAAAVLAGKTKFCNFVYSNAKCRFRTQFFDRLSRYKRIDAGGKLRNNLGGQIPDKSRGKLEFIAQYKFTIAFENCSHPGYTTEKLAQPMWAASLPIYWGNPLVHRDFNTRSFLNYFDHGSVEALIDRIIEVDRSDELYLDYVRQPWLLGNRVPAAFEKANVQAFFRRAIECQRVPVALRPAPTLFQRVADWWPLKNAAQPARAA